jgi:hypothetical protein
MNKIAKSSELKRITEPGETYNEPKIFMENEVTSTVWKYWFAPSKINNGVSPNRGFNR